jgi:CRISPR-associated protein Cas2
MARAKVDRSKYKTMWLFALYDLPVVTKEEKKEYARFHEALKNEGFSMLQFSVYARYCASEESSKSYRKHVRRTLPPDGEVRVLTLTDRQFEKMEVFRGKIKASREKRPEQLLLF